MNYSYTDGNYYRGGVPLSKDRVLELLNVDNSLHMRIIKGLEENATLGAWEGPAARELMRLDKELTALKRDPQPVKTQGRLCVSLSSMGTHVGGMVMCQSDAIKAVHKAGLEGKELVFI